MVWRRTTRGARFAAAAAAAALVLAACGSGGSSSGSSTPSSTPAAGSSAASGSIAASSANSGSSAPSKTEGPATGAPYKIGGLLGLTGSYATLGTNEQKSVQIYVDQINKKGGVNGHPLQVVFADTTSSESEAVNQLRKLATQDNVIAVVGPSSSGEGIAVKPISLALKTPVVVAASSKGIVTPMDQAKYIFKEFPATDASLEAQLTYVKDQSWKKVAILYSNNGYGQEAAKDLPNMVGDFGLEVVSSESFDPTATNMTPQLTAIAKTNPDVVLIWAVNPANAIVAKNAKDMDFKPVLFNSPGAASPQYIAVGGDAVNGTLVQGSMVAVPNDVPADSPQHDIMQTFLQTWNANTTDPPNQYAANGWDCMLILVNALEKIDPNLTDTQQIRDALRDSLENNTKDLAGINAIYNFSAEQHGPSGIKGLAVLKIDGGKWQLVKAY